MLNYSHPMVSYQIPGTSSPRTILAVLCRAVTVAVQVLLLDLQAPEPAQAAVISSLLALTQNALHGVDD